MTNTRTTQEAAAEAARWQRFAADDLSSFLTEHERALADDEVTYLRELVERLRQYAGFNEAMSQK